MIACGDETGTERLNVDASISYHQDLVSDIFPTTSFNTGMDIYVKLSLNITNTTDTIQRLEYSVKIPFAQDVSSEKIDTPSNFRVLEGNVIEQTETLEYQGNFTIVADEEKTEEMWLIIKGIRSVDTEIVLDFTASEVLVTGEGRTKDLKFITDESLFEKLSIVSLTMNIDESIVVWTNHQLEDGVFSIEITNIDSNQIIDANSSYRLNNYDMSQFEAGDYKLRVQMRSNQEGFTDSDYRTIYFSKLERPNLSISNGFATWNEITGAESYLLLIGSEERDSLTNSFDLSLIEDSGTYTISVRAYPKDEDSFVSNPSIIRNFTKLAAPVVTKLSSFRASWTPINDATRYEILVNGEVQDTVTTTSYDFTPGTYTFTVRAIASNDNIINSNQSNQIQVDLAGKN